MNLTTFLPVVNDLLWGLLVAIIQVQLKSVKGDELMGVRNRTQRHRQNQGQQASTQQGLSQPYVHK